MKCREVMIDNPIYCLPEDTVGEVARLMRRNHIGSVPVVSDERNWDLVGILTERDLATKVVGESRDANRTLVCDVMTSIVVACRDDDDVTSAVLAMEEYQLRRVPVINQRGRMVGMISHGDVSIPIPQRIVPTLWQAA